MKYFGTDGIRGPYGGEIVNDDLAFALGRALVKHLRGKGIDSGAVLLGRDTRPSGEKLLHAATSGIMEEGFQPVDAGILPTPVLAYGVIKEKFQMGIMITASHNPHSDNGLKLFSAGGNKLTREEEREIEKKIEIHPFSNAPKKKLKAIESIEPYLQYLRNFFPPNFLSGTKIVADLANGATRSSTPRAIQSFGGQLVCINLEDGEINQNAGSECTKGLEKKVIEENADFGFAHDGDGDRVVFVDSLGKVIEGDCILGLLAKSSGEKEFVGTIHSNSGLDEFLSEEGIQFHRASVGDRNVSVMMGQKNCNWGGESSGHVVAKKFLPTGDGLFTALSVFLALQHQKLSLHELVAQVKLWPSRHESLKIKQKIPLNDCPEIQKVLKEADKMLGTRGRSLLRYSGTESKIRLLVEAKSSDILEKVFRMLVAVIRKNL